MNIAELAIQACIRMTLAVVTHIALSDKTTVFFQKTVGVLSELLNKAHSVTALLFEGAGRVILSLVILILAFIAVLAIGPNHPGEIKVALTKDGGELHIKGS